MNAPFLSDLEQVFAWMFAASWQASVLALCVLLIKSLFGARLNPRWGYALWLLVLVRLVLPIQPESALSLFQFAPPPPVALTVTVTEPLFVTQPIPVVPNFPGEAPEPVRPFTLYSLIAVVWLAGAVILLVLTWLVNRRFARQVANSPEVFDQVLLRLLSEAKTELGVRRSIRLIENSQLQSPAIMGLFESTLLLPANVREKFDARELRFIFLHELAHLKRGDVLAQALIALLQILHWFNPVLWFAFRRMRIDREPATDALVLSRTGEQEKENYGLMLIKLLEHFNQRHSFPTLVGILEDKDQFKRRFSLISRFTHGAYGWSLLGVLLIGILGVACLTKGKGAVSMPETKAPLVAVPYIIDLKPYYSLVFQPDGSDSRYQGYAGRKTIDGLPFDIDGEFLLFGRENADRNMDYPDKISGIKIGRKFDELHLVHAVEWREYYGCPVAIVRLHYADGTNYDFPIRFNLQVSDWNRLLTEDAEIVADPDTKIIWRGAGAAEGTGRLFKSVLHNPFPGKQVDSMDVLSTLSGCSYALVAATVAQSDPHRDVTEPMPLLPSRHFDGTLNVHVIDSTTGAPVVGAEVYPAMTIGDISLVADNVLTGPDGIAPVKFPKDTAKDLRIKVAKTGYLACETNWEKGWDGSSAPADITYKLEPGRDPMLDARNVIGHWKPASGSPRGFDVEQVRLFLHPPFGPIPFPPDANTPEKRGEWLQVWTTTTEAGRKVAELSNKGTLLQLKPDGTFVGKGVMPGDYVLENMVTSLDGQPEKPLEHRIVTVPPKSENDADTPVDLGEIEVEKYEPPPAPILDARKVIGHWKLAPGTPADVDLQQVHLYLNPKLEPPPFPPDADTPEKRLKWFQIWSTTDAGQKFKEMRKRGRLLEVKADGTFVGEVVAPGEYVLVSTISLNGRPEQPLEHRIVNVPPKSGNAADTPVDLGEIEVGKYEPPQAQPVDPGATPQMPDAGKSNGHYNDLLNLQHIPSLKGADMPLADFLQKLSQLSARIDPQKIGVNFVLRSNTPGTEPLKITYDSGLNHPSIYEVIADLKARYPLRFSFDEKAGAIYVWQLDV